MRKAYKTAGVTGKFTVKLGLFFFCRAVLLLFCWRYVRDVTLGVSAEEEDWRWVSGRGDGRAGRDD